MTIGERIKTARKAAGLTQAQLAEKSTVAAISIHQYEAGKREPRIEQVQRIADALRLPVSSLVGDSTGLQETIFEKLQEAAAHARAAEEAQTPWSEQSESMEFLRAYIEAQNIAKKKNAVDAQVRGERKNKLVQIYEKLNDSCQEKVLGYAEGLAADEENLVQYISLPSPFQEVSDEKENPRPKPEAVDVSDPDTDG